MKAIARFALPAIILMALLATPAPCGEEAKPQTELTSDERAAMARRAKEFARDNRLELAHQDQAVTILPLAGKWRRVRLSLEAGHGVPIIRQLLISTDGKVVDATRHDAVVWEILRDALPQPQAEAEHLRWLECFIVAISAYDTRIVSKPEDIGGGQLRYCSVMELGHSVGDAILYE